MMTPLDLSKVLVGGLLLSARSAAAQQWWQVENMAGGNGLCADPASLGPNVAVGAYVPVKEGKDKALSYAIAKRGATMYLEDVSLQSAAIEEILAACNAKDKDILKSLVVTGACQQVVSGTNYKVVSTMDVPCSDENRAALPEDADLTIRIQTAAYVPLPQKGKAKAPQIKNVAEV